MGNAFFFDGTRYWSEGDEKAHFDLLAAIACIQSVKGQGTRVYLDIDRANVSDHDLRELKAVYRRYKGDVSQLTGIRTNAPN
ncbi:hypothetical protein [Sphingobium sp. SCG-1]|uniref:hypothetical protein n=1 Tax=Sphingobium sp. SCG-1 TaxID=2072936 RepID=UPI001670E6F0|nr:hypothetical protein [Sphingobium sp. SCG-1]